MIDLIITIIIFAVVFGLVFWLVKMLPLPAPFAQIVQVAVVLICILLLLDVVFSGVAIPHTRWGLRG